MDKDKTLELEANNTQHADEISKHHMLRLEQMKKRIADVDSMSLDEEENRIMKNQVASNYIELLHPELLNRYNI